jgi:hypothetical protein
VVGGPILVAGDLEVTGNLLGTHASNPSAHHTRYSDNEAWNAVLSNDGPGSGLNADLLDGSHASSFASSSHSHSGLLLKTTVLSVNCSTLNPFITSYRKITDVGSFTKQESGSTLEITFNGRIYAATMDGTGAVFELRVDDAATTNGRARASLRSSEAGGGGIQASMTGIFTGLGAGSHTVSVWVAGAFNGGTSAYVDPGCWGSDHVVIKEFK